MDFCEILWTKGARPWGTNRSDFGGGLESFVDLGAFSMILYR